MEVPSHDECSSCRYMVNGTVIRADYVIKFIRKCSRPAMTSLVTETNQVRAPEAPYGIDVFNRVLWRYRRQSGGKYSGGLLILRTGRTPRNRVAVERVKHFVTRESAI